MSLSSAKCEHKATGATGATTSSANSKPVCSFIRSRISALVRLAKIMSEVRSTVSIGLRGIISISVFCISKKANFLIVLRSVFCPQRYTYL
jgi:hypothetical protein